MSLYLTLLHLYWATHHPAEPWDPHEELAEYFTLARLSPLQEAQA